MAVGGVSIAEREEAGSAGPVGGGHWPAWLPPAGFEPHPSLQIAVPGH